VEPYVVTADVYAVSPHIGRGGWSWYTGSSGWMYRLMLESMLGLTRLPDRLQLSPRMPADWEGFTLSYRHGESVYKIRVVRGDGPLPAEIPFTNEPGEHEVEVRVPR
jgi:cellobiose phosphorylase